MKNRTTQSTAYHRGPDGYGMFVPGSTNPQTPRAFAPREPVALAPEALGGFFDQVGELAGSSSDSIIVVPIRGPLMQHDDYWYDNYESIKSRVTDALEARPRAVVLAISSPGGLVSGCFECANDLRELAEIADVPLHAYVDGQATSAAYALACAARSITCPEAGTVGSVGVIGGLVDVTAMDKTFGVRFEILASGDRKTDGHPHVSISDDAIKATQARIDALAEIFFAHVASARALPVESVRAQQAAIFTGAAGRAAGLVDRVGSLDGLLRSLANGEALSGPLAQTNPADAAEGKNQTMKTLLRALGLTDNASEAEALTALQGVQASHSRLLALSGKSTVGEAEATFLGWKLGFEKASETEAKLVAFQKSQVDAEAKNLIDEAIKDGKLPPANRTAVESLYAANGIDALKTTLSILTPIVTTKQEPKAGEPGNGGAALSNEDRAIAKALGLSEDKALGFKRDFATKGGAA